MQIYNYIKMNKRASNIELLRIIAMMLVLLLHANFLSLGGVEKITSIESFSRFMAGQLCIICVNVFILISGWFGINPHLKGAFSLLFQVFFYAIFITLPFALMGERIELGNLIDLFYFGSFYWFVPAYLVLYGFSPVLNAFVKQSSVRQYFFVLLTFFIFEFSLGWIRGEIATYNFGYSTISFIGLYLLGRFLNLHFHSIKQFSMTKYILLYLLFTIIPVLWFLFTGDERNMFAYSSPFVIFASMFFFLAFTKLKFENKYVNYLACSSFSIYLIHMHPSAWPYYKNIIATAYENLNGLVFILFMFLFVFVFSVFCMILDKLRIQLWNYLYKTFIDKWIFGIEALAERFCDKMAFNKKE